MADRWTYRYRDSLMMRHGGEPQPGLVTSANCRPRRLQPLNICGRDIGAMMLPAVYRGPSESGQEAFGMAVKRVSVHGAWAAGRRRWVASLLTAVAFIGFFAAARRRLTVAEDMSWLTIAMVVFVPARTFRYVLPLAPFVVFYFLNGIQAIETRFSRYRLADPAVRIVAACMAAAVRRRARAIHRATMRSGRRRPWLKEHGETKTVTDWLTRTIAGRERGE